MTSHGEDRMEANVVKLMQAEREVNEAVRIAQTEK